MIEDFSPKRFLLTVAGDLINVDYVVRLYEDAAGKVFADMASGPDIELRVNPSTLNDLRRLMPMNAVAP
jgi:hypothetical protein